MRRLKQISAWFEVKMHVGCFMWNKSGRNTLSFSNNKLYYIKQKNMYIALDEAERKVKEWSAWLYGKGRE